ncbi:MAG TPA: LOG family protein [Candidatus Omnitrophota bacterium]|nr:LOG family protein [Candidatus Omnitrophota bacterium]
MRGKNGKNPWLVKAYKNIPFLNSPPARPIRILAEMIEPEVRCSRHGITGTVVFFGSARTLSEKEAEKDLKNVEEKIRKTGKASDLLTRKYHDARNNLEMSAYYEDARDLSEKLSRAFKKRNKKGDKIVISTGGGPGIMEAANLGAKKAGCESMGFNISLPMEQTPNEHQTKDLAFEFHYFFVRKFWFVNLAKAIIVFPGGFGTMDEFFELLTLIQTGKSRRRIPVILYGEKYWKDIINFDNLVKWGMISKEDLGLFRIFSDVDGAFSFLKKELGI